MSSESAMALKGLKEIDGKKFIDATTMSLDDWLALLNSDRAQNTVFISWAFPTHAMQDEYLKTIHKRTDKDVINLIRNFLVPSGSLGSDDYKLDYLLYCSQHNKEQYRRLMETEYYKRLLKGYIKGNVWEGNTWVIDLLPHWPRLALDALDAYLQAHCQFLPDGRLDGLADAMALIRAKFIQTPRSALLSSLNPYRFEHLIDALYMEMGYSTTLTQMTHDGGRDIIAEKSGAAKREKLLIQCRRSRHNIGVDAVRSLLGIVSNEKATKGVLVCTSRFTPSARKLEKENSRLELIDHEDLQQLLNEHLGPAWPNHIDYHIKESLSKTRKSRSLG